MQSLTKIISNKNCLNKIQCREISVRWKSCDHVLWKRMLGLMLGGYSVQCRVAARVPCRLSKNLPGGYKIGKQPAKNQNFPGYKIGKYSGLISGWYSGNTRLIIRVITALYQYLPKYCILGRCNKVSCCEWILLNWIDGENICNFLWWTGLQRKKWLRIFLHIFSTDFRKISSGSLKLRVEALRK